MKKYFCMEQAASCFSLLTIFALINVSCLGCMEHEREALMKFKHALKDPSRRLASWGATSNCCQWRGITCENQTGHVIKLSLRSFDSPYRDPLQGDIRVQDCWNLSGHIDPVLLELKHIQYLDLSSNAFEDIPIPSFLGSMKELRSLNLSRAGFSGEIPPQLGNLSKLEYLDVSSSFYGFGPLLYSESLHWLKGLPSLKTLEMNDVELSATSKHWVHVVNNLPSLAELRLCRCDLSHITKTLPVINLTSMRVLDISLNSFQGVLPAWVANLSKLETIILNDAEFQGQVLYGLSELPRLKELDLRVNSFAGNCTQLLGGSWRSIKNMVLSDNNITGELPRSVGNMTTLISLYLARNYINGNIPNTIGNLISLELLDLSGNNFSGSIPMTIGNLCMLKNLDLSDNMLEGLPKNLKVTGCSESGAFPHLKTMVLRRNRLGGVIPNWIGNLKALNVLDLKSCMLSGLIPVNFGGLSSLEELHLENNHLVGAIPVPLGKLSKLRYLNLAYNSLSGNHNETHFKRLENLEELFLSFNSFILDLRSNWVPPFQLSIIELGSCSLGAQFPQWLKTQKYVQVLDLSNTTIMGPLPSWFWDLATQLYTLDLSHNMLHGQLPDPLILQPTAYVDLSFNSFSGSIPCPLNPLNLLDLSKNQLSGPLPPNFTMQMSDSDFFSASGNRINGRIPIDMSEMGQIRFFDLSRNELTGNIPSSLGNCSYLQTLDLSENYLSGEIPTSFGLLIELKSLHLSSNNLYGVLPLSIRNCTSLDTLDLGENSFSGSIPSWVVESFFSLRVLRLQSNKFTGHLPSNLSYMSSLQILDVSKNQLSGPIPTSLGNLPSMKRRETTSYVFEYEQKQASIENSILEDPMKRSYYEEKLFILVKGQMLEYKKTLFLVISIDLSSNNLHGEIPEELTRLTALLFLNLSNNHLSGKIPKKMGELEWLESLDMSNNRLSGEIPPSLSSLTYLSRLNLSNNNLSGKIPTGNQLQTLNDPSIYAGNLDLCGLPLAVQCSSHKIVQSTQDGGDKDGHEQLWFYTSMVVGFVVGFWGLCGLIILNKSIRISYFRFFDEIGDKLFVLIAVNLAKFKGRKE